MIVAGILTPVDFGIVAAAMVVVTLAQIVVGLGMGAAVIQRQTEVEESASVAFGLSIVMAVLLYAGLWWMSPGIALFYQNPALVDVIRVSGLNLFLSAFVSIPTALLQRRLEFRRLFWIGAAPQIITALALVAFALAGGGYWALVIGQLAGLTVNVALVWRASVWRPARVFNLVLARSLFVFGIWIMVSSFLSWLFLYGDNVIAGYFLGVQGLGEYSLGFTIISLLPGMIVAPIAVVAYPAFCALQGGGPREVGMSMLKLQRSVAAILFPMCFGISAVAVPAISLLYGSRWAQLGFVVQWLILLPGLSSVWTLNADAYRAIGKPQTWTKVAFINLMILIPLLIVAAPFGMKYFVMARFAGASLYPILNIMVGGRVLKLSIKEQLKPLGGTLLPALFMYMLAVSLVAMAAPFDGLSGWLKLMVIIAIGAGSYIGILKWRYPDLFHSIRSSLLRSLT